MSRPRAERDRRRAILEAALHVFAEKGFHLATVEEIAARAGVGKGTVYEYFDSKTELFQGMIRAAMEAYLEALQRAVAERGRCAERLERALLLSLEFMKRNQPLARAVMEQPGSISRSLQEWLHRARDQATAIARAIVEEGVRRGEFRPVDPDVAAYSFFGTVHVLAVRLLWGPDSPAAAEVGARAWDLLWRGLAADREDSRTVEGEREG
ncbi:MAG: TetR/AcrR family transcriptional regulator [Clostridia bacterium]|nr:TetR/AcrR family transcriptional regulator [Clostridia bacterium]